MGDTRTPHFGRGVWQELGVKSALWSCLCLRHGQVLVTLIFKGSSELPSGQVLFKRHFLERGGSPCLPSSCVVGQSWRRT